MPPSTSLSVWFSGSRLLHELGGSWDGVHATTPNLVFEYNIKSVTSQTVTLLLRENLHLLINLISIAFILVVPGFMWIMLYLFTSVMSTVNSTCSIMPCKTQNHVSLYLSANAVFDFRFWGFLGGYFVFVVVVLKNSPMVSPVWRQSYLTFSYLWSAAVKLFHSIGPQRDTFAP